MEFELHPDGRLRYANDSKYKKGGMIRKEMSLSSGVADEVSGSLLRMKMNISYTYLGADLTTTTPGSPYC
jgi:hypothetical protein